MIILISSFTFPTARRPPSLTAFVYLRIQESTTTSHGPVNTVAIYISEHPVVRRLHSLIFIETSVVAYSVDEPTVRDYAGSWTLFQGRPLGSNEVQCHSFDKPGYLDPPSWVNKAADAVLWIFSTE